MGGAPQTRVYIRPSPSGKVTLLLSPSFTILIFLQGHKRFLPAGPRCWDECCCRAWWPSGWWTRRTREVSGRQRWRPLLGCVKCYDHLSCLDGFMGTVETNAGNLRHRMCLVLHPCSVGKQGAEKLWRTVEDVVMPTTGHHYIAVSVKFIVRIWPTRSKEEWANFFL